jgi:predicted TPR repeat methyltransferase
MKKERTYFETPLQKIELEDISDFDRVLDIGAGGEGLVARIRGEQVYGIDISVDEMKEVKGNGVFHSLLIGSAVLNIRMW